MDANYNLEGLINRVKTRLDDEEYSSDTITQFINDAYFDAMGDQHYQFLEKIYQTTAQEGGTMVLPCDYQSAIQITAKAKNGLYTLKYMPFSDFVGYTAQSGAKNYRFSVFGNNLFFEVPKIGDSVDPDDSDEYYTLTLFYLAKPRQLVNLTDVPAIPAEFGEALVLGALARAERLRDNYDYAQIYENKYDDIVTNMKLRYCPRNMSEENRAVLPVAQRLRH